MVRTNNYLTEYNSIATTIVFMIAVLTVSGLTNISYGQTLSDWQNALSTAKGNISSNRWAGLRSIPYDNIRQAAQSEQAILDDLEVVTYRCVAEKHGTLSLRNSIKANEDNLSKITNESDKTKVTDLIKTQKEQLQDRIQKAQQRADFAQKLATARKNVSKQVQYAIDKAKGESDPAIKPIAQELAVYWDNDKRFHLQAIENADKAAENCKACAEGRM